MTSFQFAAPWVLSLALIIPALLVAFHMLSRQRTQPATMNHAAAGLIRDLPRSWRITWRPVTTVLRVMAIMLMARFWKINSLHLWACIRFRLFME